MTSSSASSVILALLSVIGCTACAPGSRTEDRGTAGGKADDLDQDFAPYRVSFNGELLPFDVPGPEEVSVEVYFSLGDQPDEFAQLPISDVYGEITMEPGTDDPRVITVSTAQEDGGYAVTDTGRSTGSFDITVEVQELEILGAEGTPLESIGDSPQDAFVLWLYCEHEGGEVGHCHIADKVLHRTGFYFGAPDLSVDHRLRSSAAGGAVSLERLTR